MTSYVDIVNRALAVLGTRTTVSAAELDAQSSNEAIQAALHVASVRDDLLRMAPWDFALTTEVAQMLCAAPGTVENPNSAPNLWQRGNPPPPWAYEYAYPYDCLRFIRVLPFNYTAPQGVPVYPIATGYAAFPTGREAPHKVSTDKLYPLLSAVPGAPGLGYAVGDAVQLFAPVQGDFDPLGTSFDNSSAPAGCPAEFTVTGVNVFGGITSVQIAPLPMDLYTGNLGLDITNWPGYPAGGYFAAPRAAIPVAKTTGAGINATLVVTPGPRTNMRVVLTDQDQAVFQYIRQVIDPNAMDPLFIEAWVQVLGAKLCMALLGDKTLANSRLQLANTAISAARVADGNESREVIDVLPDWLRARGIAHLPCDMPYDWGPLWPNV